MVIKMVIGFMYCIFFSRKRLQQLTDSLQTMEETRFQMQQQIQQQQMQQQTRQSPGLRPTSHDSRRSADSATRRAAQPVSKPPEPASITPDKVPAPPRTSPSYVNCICITLLKHFQMPFIPLVYPIYWIIVKDKWG